jgi:C1A family cysteine protease
MTLTLSPAGRRYGYLKDKLDHRDFGMATAPLSPNLGLAPSTDLEAFVGAVLDQGDEGSCTAHYGAKQLTFLYKKYKDVDAEFSPSFIYYKSREFDGSLDQGDCGSMGRSVVHVLNQFGAALRSDEPYTPGDFSTPPTDAQLTEALAYKAGAYHRISNVQDMKTSLASGYVFGIGFTVYESFESIKSDGLWAPDTTENVLGGHETTVIGYDDSVNGGSFKVRNSWGTSFGQSGNFWLRYSDAGNPDILQDAWMIHLGRKWG